MPQVRTLPSVLFRESSFTMQNLILVIFMIMPLAGCSNDGAGGPVISSLSTPTDSTDGLDSDQPSNADGANSAMAHSDDGDPVVTMTSTPAGITVQLTWDRPSDFEVSGYSIYYGKRSPEEPRSDDANSDDPNSVEPSTEKPDLCSWGESKSFEAPPATITGLEPNTPYFFAIRAFTDSGSICSNEITAVTPSAES